MKHRGSERCTTLFFLGLGVSIENFSFVKTELSCIHYFHPLTHIAVFGMLLNPASVFSHIPNWIKLVKVKLQLLSDSLKVKNIDPILVFLHLTELNSHGK